MSLTALWHRLIMPPLVLAMLIVFAGLAGFVGWNSTHGEAQSHTAILAVPPWYLEDVSAPNPVLNLTERTTALASALVVALKSDDTAKYVAAGGATGYTATNIRDNLRFPEPTSVISFDVTGPDISTAHAGAQRLIDQTTQILTRIQTNAAVGQTTNQAKLQVIVAPQETMSLVAKQQIRAAVVFALATFLAGVLLCWGVDAILDWRGRSRAREMGSVRSRPNGSEASAPEGLDPLHVNGRAHRDLAGHSER